MRWRRSSTGWCWRAARQNPAVVPTDLFALADSLADAIGGAVVIHDRLLRVLAYSRQQQHADSARVATILERQTPEQLRALFEARGVFAHLAVSDDPLFVAEDAEHGMNGRMVVAVRSGRELIGSVWVACSAPLDRRRAQRLGRWRAHGGPASAAVTSQRGPGAPDRVRTGDPVAGGHR